MNRRIKMIIMMIMLVTGMIQFKPAFAAAEHFTRVLNVSETAYYKNTAITLQKIEFTNQKTTIHFRLQGPQVETLIMNQVGSVKVHRYPIVEVFDDKGNKLLHPGEGTGSYIGGKGHNISSDTLEFSLFYNPLDKSIKNLTIQVMDFHQKERNQHLIPISEFEVPVEK